MDACMWHDQRGQLWTANKYAEAQLPAELANYALEHGLADRFGTRRTTQLLATFGRSLPAGPRPERSHVANDGDRGGAYRDQLRIREANRRVTTVVQGRFDVVASVT